MTDTKPAVPAAPLPWPADDFSVYGPVEQRAVGKIQHYVGRVMQRNWTSIPHVTHNDEAEVSGFEQRRKHWNAAHPDQKRTLLPALIKEIGRAPGRDRGCQYV